MERMPPKAGLGRTLYARAFDQRPQGAWSRAARPPEALPPPSLCAAHAVGANLRRPLQAVQYIVDHGPDALTPHAQGASHERDRQEDLGALRHGHRG
eukprot:6550907-Prymnesium_polylepis.1